MRDIYIIVHEEEVRIENDADVALSVRAYRDIREIKQSREFRKVDGDPTKIPDDLPLPQECRIHVCGSSLANCIPKQIDALKKEGYNPVISRSASIY